MNPNFKRNIKREGIQSETFQEEKEILISFPPDYKPQQRYPVLLLHDGDDYFHMGRIVTQVNPLIDLGQLKPFLILGLPVKKKDRTEEYSPLGSRHHQHLRFLAEELLPIVKERYPSADFSPGKWVIGGSSLGGIVSLHFALTFPNLCKRVLLQSSAFFDETFHRINHTYGLEQMQIYQSIGRNETSVPTSIGNVDFLVQNRKAYHLLVDQKAVVKYVEAEGDHTWRFWQKDLIDALRFFFNPH